MTKKKAKPRLPPSGEETADSSTKHVFKMRRISAFPNSLQPTACLPE